MTLPTGAVTFLFTDVEASTRLLVGDAAAYPAVVTVQRAVSVDARAAIEAAATAQRPLAAHLKEGS